jgi:hypothetical protein
MTSATVYAQFISAEAGGRSLPTYVKEPYRPHFRVGNGEYLGIEFIDAPEEPIPSGVGVNAKVRFIYSPQVNYEALCVGVQFVVLEGVHIVGVGRVISLTNTL